MKNNVGMVLEKDLSVIVGESIFRVCSDPQNFGSSRFVLGRSLFLAKCGVTDLIQTSKQGFETLIKSVIKVLFPGRHEGITLPKTKVKAAKRMLPNSLQDEVRPFALDFFQGNKNVDMLWTSLINAANRAGFIAANSLSRSVSHLSKVNGDACLSDSLENSTIADLLHFAVSEKHVKLRAHIG